MRARLTALFVAALLPAACDAGPPEVALQVGGDTLRHAATFDLPDGQQSVRCRYSFRAHLPAEASAAATITGGRITFSFLDTGLDHLTWEWTPERLPQLWPEPAIAPGDTLRSQHQDIGFSQPFRPVRASAVFDYTLAGSDAVHATEPFVFTCR